MKANRHQGVQMRRLSDEERRALRSPMESTSPMEGRHHILEAEGGEARGGPLSAPGDDFGAPLPDLPGGEKRDYVGTFYDFCVIIDKATDMISRDGMRLFRALRREGNCQRCGEDVGDFPVCPYCGAKSADKALEDAIAWVKRFAQVGGRISRAFWNYGPARQAINRGLEGGVALLAGRATTKGLRKYKSLYKKWKKVFGEPILRKAAIKGDESSFNKITEEVAATSYDWMLERGLSEEDAMKGTIMAMNDYLAEINVEGAHLDELFAAWKPGRVKADKRDMQRFKRYKDLRL